jgi:hypothetical protein
VLAALTTAFAAGTASAGTLAEALAKSDIAGLRAQLPDPAARCTLGAAYAKKKDLPRAALFLADCEEVSLPEDVSAEVARISREVKKQLRESEMSQLAIISQPEAMTAELAALPGEALITPITVWVKAGNHTVTATFAGKTYKSSVTVQPYARGSIILDASTAAATPAAPKDGKVDFAEDNAGEKTDGPPPDVKRRSMMSDKQLGITGPRSGPELADPLATAPPPAPLPMWIGVRLGGGMFDDGAATARVRPSVAAAARYMISGPAFVSARIDWTRRGGKADDSVDTIGVSGGAGYTVLGARAIEIALIGQLRGDLRFADTRNQMSVNRAGATVAAELEIAFPTTPLTAGIRFEQGLTELVPGYRDRALLVELGVDWR